MAHACGSSIVERLPAELLAEIHGRLTSFVDRLAFASACGAPSRRLMKPELPCLLLPGSTPGRVTLHCHSGGAADARAPDPAMRDDDYLVLGTSSSGGWLVTADDRGTLQMANLVTGEQADLPAITTTPSICGLYSGGWFCLALAPFAEARFGRRHDQNSAAAGGDCWVGTFTHTAADMRLYFYRKVVLSVTPGGGPGQRRTYAAMLLLQRRFGAPAFATAEDPAWRVAPSCDGVEDAIHHNGAFYSVTYTGDVEAWARDAETGEFTSRAVAPRLAFEERDLCRKYLAAAPDGRLMAVLKYSKEEKVQVHGGYGYQSSKVTRVSFKVQVLDDVRQRWEKTTDIGDAALFVGVNGTMCVPAREYPRMCAGCVYFANDDVGEAWLHRERHSRQYSYGIPDDVWDVGIPYSLKDRTASRIVVQKDQPRWPPPAWFVPSV
ncbi:unnamed protein product [Urochloa humidicola]